MSRLRGESPLRSEKKKMKESGMKKTVATPKVVVSLVKQMKAMHKKAVVFRAPPMKKLNPPVIAARQ